MIDDQNGIGRARRYSIVYGMERLMRAFPAFYLLATYPLSPFIGASREVAGSPCFPIFPLEAKDVRAAREQSSGSASVVEEEVVMVGGIPDCAGG